MTQKSVLRLIETSLFLSVVFTACDRFEYHPYNTGIEGPVSLHGRYIPVIEQKCRDRQTVRIAFITDTQGSYEEMADAIDIIRSRNDIDFIIHGGDQTDFGLPKEYVWSRDLMEKSGLPYVTVIGNHDCLGNGEYTYRYMFGNSNFSFNAGHVHFLCLNTIALEYDYSNPIPDLDFIENDAAEIERLNSSRDSITHTIAVMHSRPGDEQFNNNVAKIFNLYLMKFPGAGTNDEHIVSESDSLLDGTCRRAFCINGHNHRHETVDIFNQGILYYGCANIAKRSFYIFTVTPEGYEYEQVDF